MHQYIGARYVPYFYENSLDPTSTEWEPNVNYEPLTIVTLPNLHSYISKKFVPDTIGSPALNAAYWLDRGYDNAYIQALQDEVDDMKDGTVPGSLQNQINEVNTLAQDAHDIATGARKKFWYIGDSFLEMADGWGTQMDTFLNLSDSLKTCDGAIGFCSDAYGNNTGMNLPTLVNTITPDDDVTDVIVIAGCNDCNPDKAQNTITNGVQQTIDNIRAKLPDAKIHFSYNATYFSAGLYDNRTASIAEVYHAIKSIVMKNANCAFMRGPAYAIQNSVLAVDAAGVHLVTTGYELMARSIINSVYGGGDCTLTFNRSANIIKFTDICNLDKIHMEVQHIGAEAYNSATPIAINVGSFTDIATNMPVPFKPRATYDFALTVPCIVKDNNNVSTHGVMLNFLIRPDGRLSVSSASGSNYSNIIFIGTEGIASKEIVVFPR